MAISICSVLGHLQRPPSEASLLFSVVVQQSQPLLLLWIQGRQVFLPFPAQVMIALSVSSQL